MRHSATQFLRPFHLLLIGLFMLPLSVRTQDVLLLHEQFLTSANGWVGRSYTDIGNTTSSPTFGWITGVNWAAQGGASGSFRHNIMTAPGAWFAWSPGITLTAGQQYYLKFGATLSAANSDNRNRAQIRVGTTQLALNSATLLMPSTNVVTSGGAGGYVEYTSSVYTAPATGTYFFAVGNFFNANGLAFYVDGIRIYQVNSAPTLSTGTVSGSPLCAGASVSVPYTAAGTYNAGNVFTAQLSNAAGSFASPVNIGTVSATASGSISATLPSNTPSGTGYRIRVVSSTPAVNGTDNGVNLAINALQTWYLDADGDTYYASTQQGCTSPGPGWTSALPTGGAGDCNDGNAGIHPGAADICGNGIDENCSGTGAGDFTVSAPTPASATVCTNVPGPTYTVNVTGAGTYTYQWFANSLNNNSGGSSQGATNGAQTASYTPNASGAPGTLYFYCRVTEVGSGCPAMASATAQRTVVNCNAPANDARAAAIPLNSYTMGTCLGTPGDLTDASASPESQTSLPAGGQDLWYRFVANAPGVRVQVAATAFNAFIELQDAAGTVIATENAVSANGGEILNHYIPGSPLVTGQTYFIAVRNVDTSPLSGATFTICVQRIRGTTCNTNSANTCGLVQAVFVGAQGYSFAFNSTSVIPQLGNVHSVTINPAGGFTSAPLNGLIPSVQYTVAITASYNLFDAAGNPENFSVPPTSVCTFTMQQHAGVFLRDADDCPEPVTSTRVIGANVWVCGASYYEWTFTPAVGLPITLNGSPGNRFLAMSAAIAAGLTPGSYNVTVRPFFISGQVSSSAVPAVRCLILAGPGGMALEATEAPAAPALRSASGPQADVALYPNPFNGELLTLNATGLTGESMQVRILDGTGRVVWSSRYAADGSLRTVVAFDRALIPGVYLVEMIGGGLHETQRIVVQN